MTKDCFKPHHEFMSAAFTSMDAMAVSASAFHQRHRQTKEAETGTPCPHSMALDPGHANSSAMLSLIIRILSKVGIVSHRFLNAMLQVFFKKGVPCNGHGKLFH